ncbi:methanogenesis marker 3 protein [uncultured Methanobrevibacter sp.]|uniref:methyl-coenzyme M reductase-associated protein Mmp3 n=1 Tax=uncultured Methanobrevibacter sp. TaxID=253161 RepID=UPI0026207B45|nr:methanogenesis marker 3 protein [uncultured Methanobrevibacter sp.]
MLIRVNGEEMDVAEGSTIQKVIDESNAPYTPGSIVCLIKGKKELEKNITKFKIKTTQGSVILELLNVENAQPLVDVWKNQYKYFEKLSVRWSTSNEVAIGPIITDLKPTSEEYNYYEGDVVLSLSSFSNESTHLILIKENTTNVYGVPPFNKGIFAKIIGGKKTLNLLSDADEVISIEPIIERSTTTDSSVIYDLETVLEEGNELFTYVSVDVDNDSPVSVEHFFSVIKNNKIKVDFESESFLGFYELKGINKPKENITPRTRGTITVRNSGVGVGKLYIYRENRVLSPNHTTVGKITKGMEIIDIAKQGDFITIKSQQDRLMLLGHSQNEVEDILANLGIEHIKEGVNSEDALIVEQNPKYTIDILNEGKVVTKAIPKDNLCEVKFTDNAPRTVKYFKLLSGLLEEPIGKLNVHFSVPGMHILIFEGDSNASKGLVPENNPTDVVEKCEIGVTNMSAKNVGLIGVRFEDNKEFGPTAEGFKATNIVGKVISDYSELEKYKDGDVVYVKESND